MQVCCEITLLLAETFYMIINNFKPTNQQKIESVLLGIKDNKKLPSA